MKEQNSVNTIYNYTEFSIKAQEESLNRIDAKSNSFIIFSTALIRLAVDIDEDGIKIFICFFAILSILFGAIGLIARKTGACLHPKTLLMDEYLDEEEMIHQLIIIKDQISLINEYEGLMKNKQFRINCMITSFCISVIFYGIGVSHFTEKLIKLFLIVTNMVIVAN